MRRRLTIRHINRITKAGQTIQCGFVSGKTIVRITEERKDWNATYQILVAFASDHRKFNLLLKIATDLNKQRKHNRNLLTTRLKPENFKGSINNIPHVIDHRTKLFIKLTTLNFLTGIKCHTFRIFLDTN